METFKVGLLNQGLPHPHEMSGDVVVVTSGKQGEGASGIKWVGAKEAAEHTVMLRTSSPPSPCGAEAPQPHIWSPKPHCSGLQFSATNPSKPST